VCLNSSQREKECSSEFSRAHLDDIFTVSKDSFKNEINHLEEVITRLENVGLKVYAMTSNLFWDELEYLENFINEKGVQLTMRSGIPKTQKQLRSFIGMTIKYRKMWPSRWHLLAPLPSLT
jgi:hypothetical protein